MKYDFTSDPEALRKLTSFDSFTENRCCEKCNSETCPGKKLVIVATNRKEIEIIDQYPCFIKARLLIDYSIEDSRKLLLTNRLFQYIGIKCQAVTKTTTRRGSYANLGTLLVLIKDNLDHFDDYEDYTGISFSDYFEVIRSLPGCSKMQNHAINHRLNQEFGKFFGRAEMRSDGNSGPQTFHAASNPA